MCKPFKAIEKEKITEGDKMPENRRAINLIKRDRLKNDNTRPVLCRKLVGGGDGNLYWKWSSNEKKWLSKTNMDGAVGASK